MVIIATTTIVPISHYAVLARVLYLQGMESLLI